MEEMEVERKAAEAALLNLVPESVVTLLTRETCNSGMQKLHNMLQCKVLVKNIVYTIVDIFLLRIFPGIAVEGLHQID